MPRPRADDRACPTTARSTSRRACALTFLDAGHVLGSAITVLDVDDDGGSEAPRLHRRPRPHAACPSCATRRSPTAPTCSSPRAPTATACTSRSRRWTTTSPTSSTRTYERGGKVIIPSFALERAQEVLYALKRAAQQGRMPPMPVYVDSPLTVKITDIFRLHPECYDAETRALIQGNDSPFDFEDLRYVGDKEESKAIDASTEPSVDHLARAACARPGASCTTCKATIEDREEHGLHRRLPGAAHARPPHRRAAQPRPHLRRRARPPRRGRRAERLLRARRPEGPRRATPPSSRQRGPLEHIALVHGEPQAQEVLGGKLRAIGVDDVHAPGPGESIEV